MTSDTIPVYTIVTNAEREVVNGILRELGYAHRENSLKCILEQSPQPVFTPWESGDLSMSVSDLTPEDLEIYKEKFETDPNYIKNPQTEIYADMDCIGRTQKSALEINKKLGIRTILSSDNGETLQKVIEEKQRNLSARLISHITQVKTTLKLAGFETHFYQSIF